MLSIFSKLSHFNRNPCSEEFSLRSKGFVSKLDVHICCINRKLLGLNVTSVSHHSFCPAPVNSAVIIHVQASVWAYGSKGFIIQSSPLALGWSRSDVHALSVYPSCIQFALDASKVILHPDAAYISLSFSCPLSQSLLLLPFCTVACKSLGTPCRKCWNRMEIFLIL